MAKFKKIVAAALAAVTMATAMLGASATSTFSFATTGTTYGRNSSKNYIHYKDLDYNSSKPQANIVYFKSVDRSAMEGNVVLSVDFVEDPTDYWSMIDDEVYDMIPEYMASLELRDYSGNYILKGKYPLEVVDGRFDEMNVVVSTNRIFMDSFGLSKYESFKFDLTPSTDRLMLFYYINNHHVLPSYDIVIKQRLSNGSYGATFSREPFSTHFTTVGTRNVTSGSVYFDIPKQYRNSTFDVFVNGIRVASVKHSPKAYTGA